MRSFGYQNISAYLKKLLIHNFAPKEEKAFFGWLASENLPNHFRG